MSRGDHAAGMSVGALCALWRTVCALAPLPLVVLEPVILSSVFPSSLPSSWTPLPLLWLPPPREISPPPPQSFAPEPMRAGTRPWCRPRVHDDASAAAPPYGYISPPPSLPTSPLASPLSQLPPHPLARALEPPHLDHGGRVRPRPALKFAVTGALLVP